MAGEPHCIYTLSGVADVPLSANTHRIGTRAIDANGTAVRVRSGGQPAD
jgi:hypothetical protein